MELKELSIRYLGVRLISIRLRAVDCEWIQDKRLKRAQSSTSKKLN